MRRSLDFGTLTGSLSTLKSSRSNGKDSSSAGTSTSNGLSSPSPSGSRYGTIAGVPSHDESALARPRSAIGSSTTGGATGGLHTGRARGHFGLAGLFSVGQGGSSGSGLPREVQQGEDDNTQGGTLYPSQSVTDVNRASSQAPSPSFRATAATTPSTPDTPAECERALMLAVENAKAKDQAWEIIVTQPTEKEGMFLEYAGDDRSNAPGKRNGLIKRSSSNSANVIFGKARRFLGRAGDRITAQNATASPAPPSSIASGQNEVQADASAPALADVLSVTPTTPGKYQSNMEPSAMRDPPQPTSPAKRRLESSEDDEALQMGLNVTSPTIVTSTPAAGKGASAQFANGDPSQLLVLYVTTGTSSLTLYRRLGQLVKLDDELRKHYSAHMPTTARPSILSIPLASPLISPSTGHARRKSVLASLTRTFTSPTSSRRGTPSLLSSAPSQASIAEHAGEEEEGTRPAGTETRHPHVQEQQTVDTSTHFPIFHSQLSNLSDYLSSLSCIAEIRTSKQWNSFFKPTKEDHESSRLEPVAPSTMASKGRRLKRMKSETGLETRSFISPSPVREGKTGAAQLETPERKEVRIDDSGIGTDALGHAATGPKGRNGHVMESSVTSTATSTSASVSASASTSMKREVSTGTNTSVSAMSLFIEHTEEEEEEVGDPEVLAYMERLRQDSENRNSATADPFKVASKKEVKMTPKQAVLDYAPPTPVSPAPRADVDPPPPGTLPDASTEDTIPIVNSPSDEPVLAALEESIDAEFEEETAELPPLSGATAVDSTEQHERQQNRSLGQAMDDEPVHSQIINSPLLSPDSATNGAGEDASSNPTSKKKKSVSSLRRRRKSSAANTNTTASHRARSTRTSIRIEDFEILRVLGKGCAGKVLLARLKDMTTVSTRGGSTSNNALYAIKAIHKHHVLAHRELAHTLTEQSILRKMATEMPNPFIVLMNWSFQDKENLFLVLDFHPGGDLATQLSRWGRLGKDRTRFYAAEIIEGLESLHRAGIIYRDLKPENILLAADGHIVLTDFGLSKQFARPSVNPEDGIVAPHWLKNTTNSYNSVSSISRGAETTTTFCGTAEYLAPEVLLGHAYSYPVDMWSLGTMIYEMLLGVTPFYNEDHGVMYRRVLHEQLDFGPSEYLDADTRALLRGLLQKEPEFRMTTSRVKRAKYFEAIDWQFVNNKRYIPPFIPSLSADDPADTQNFEECFLTMNLGFVDEKDTEEIEAKARTTGKEPDKPFDEQGRDVFADYSFDGAWAGPDSEDEDFEVEQEDAGATSDDEDDALEEDEEKESTEAEQEDACLPHTSSSAGHEPSGSNTSAAYVEGSQPIINKFASPVKAGQASQEDDTTPEDYPRRDPLSVVVEEPKEEDRAAPSVAVGDSLDGAGPTSHIRNSVEMPRLESPGATTGDEKAPRVSVDPEDWDVVEAMASDEVADNGRKGPRRRLMAGTNLFAKGVVDKYKLQLKPLSRVPTPTRSYTSKSPLDRQASASVQPPRSAKTSNQLSPSPSIGGMSESPSSAESNEPSIRPEKNTSRGPGRRLVTPRLLRASSDWMSSSLPSSPTPRLKLRRNKKGTAPESMTPPSEENQLQPPVEPGFVPATPKSVDSAATLPIENAGGFGLQPLTRVRSRDRGSPQSQRSQNYSHSASEGRLANETPK